jgi:dienelactone hydrolase
VSLRIFPGATHIFDSFAGAYEFSGPAANRRQGGIVHVRPDPEAREQARGYMTQFFAAAFKQQ